MSVASALGLRENAAQFALLVGLNALVGAMVGLERSVLPLIGEREFGLTSTAAILAFVRRVRRWQRPAPTSPPERSPTASGESGCSCSAGWSRSRCRC